jgi:chromosome condensin MukBEF ATPase and DNA-binding subunit MukB
MPLTPRQMARRKAEFRQGQANFNRMAQLHGNLKRRYNTVSRLYKEFNALYGNWHRANRAMRNTYNTPNETHRMMVMWRTRAQKLHRKREQKHDEIIRTVANMLPLIREYHVLRWGPLNPNNNNNTVNRNVRHNIRSRAFSPKAIARLKLARLINVAATRPGGWVSKKLFKPGNQPRAA